MSKNIVDSIIEFQINQILKVGLIPSRRQIEYDGGYCNNWTTEEFSKYASDILIKETILDLDKDFTTMMVMNH